MIHISTTTMLGSPSWDVPRNPFAALAIVQAAEARGVSPTAALRSTGLKPADLTCADLVIVAGQELTIIRNVLRRLGSAPGLGTEAGTQMTLGMLGVWGFAMLNSHTTRDAIEVAERYGYGNLSFVFTRPCVDYRRHEVQIVLDCHEVPHDVRTFLIERDLSAQASLIPRLLGKSARIIAETTLGYRGGSELARALTPHAVELSCAQNAIRIPRPIVEAPLPQADLYAVQMWTQECEQLIKHRRRHMAGSGLAAYVKVLLHREPARIPSIDELGASFNVTARTLRRRLAAEGVTFRELVDEVRKTTASDLLTDGVSVSKAADQLGFADSASFIRAFKRWTGRTPGALLDAM